MSSSSQQGNVLTMATLTGLTHDIFVGRVVNNVRRTSPSAMLFKNATPDSEYELVGQNMKFAVDLRYKTGGMATDGHIPDYVGLDAVQGKLNPTRRYARIALDNLVEKQASGKGAFENLGERIFDKLWDSWESQEIRHSIGYSSALLGVVESRTNDTTFIIKDAFGSTGTNPISHIAEGSILSWWDLTATAAIDGAGRVDSIDYETREVTMDDAATWEPGDDLAAGDLIYFATTNNISNAHFVAERNLAPNGLGTIVDPNGDLTTVHDISETTYGRWKPFRKNSVTHDHLELTEFRLALAAKRGFDVTPETDVQIAFPSVVAQIARSLMGFQQQAYSGGALEGGYRSVAVDGIQTVADHFFFRDVSMTVCKEHLFRVNLGDDVDFWGEDGSMWSRMPDFDGKDAFVVEYGNNFSNNRGAHGALTGITTDLTDSEFDPIPNH
jgi:hypothetical protein